MAAAEEERFTRVKHVAGFPGRAAVVPGRGRCGRPRARPHRRLPGSAGERRTGLAPVGPPRCERALSQGEPRPCGDAARCQDSARRRPRDRHLRDSRTGPRHRAPPDTCRERVLRVAVRRGRDPLGRRIRRLRIDHDRRRARQLVRRGRSRALPTLARNLLPRTDTVARLPPLRRRREGDGARVVRRPRAEHAPDARCAGDERRPVRAQPRLLHARQGRRGHDVGRGSTERRDPSSRTSSSKSWGRRATRRPSSRLTTTTSRRRCSSGSKRSTST